jgi:hypothetical protein
VHGVRVNNEQTFAGGPGTCSHNFRPQDGFEKHHACCEPHYLGGDVVAVDRPRRSDARQQLIQATSPRVMSVALHRSASGLLQRHSQHRTDDMSTRHQHIILKLLVSAAIALVRLVGGAAPASADPDPGRTDPNPFGGIASSCQETYPAGSPEQREEIDRGIRDGLSAWSTALSWGHSNQPRQ